MSQAQMPHAESEVQPPALPTALTDPRPVVGAGAVLWALAAVAAFAVPALHSWRPITLAGLGVGVFGASLFLWQRAAVRRGARGAQTGLELVHDEDPAHDVKE